MKVLVTGGTGFLGKALALKLRSAGHQVHTIARRDASELREKGIEHHRIDLSGDLDSLKNILTGVEAIFHTAAKVGMWGKYKDFYSVNYLGTKKLLDLAKKSGSKYFIYTSSPSVIANGQNLVNVDESQPYPNHYSANYPKTKAMAERLVLSETSDSFYTCSLRPHLIWGPGDTNLIPTIIERARSGKLVQIGRGDNKVDITYIDDCVKAHLCALQALKDTPAARGEAYFISQDEPVILWEWVNQVLKANDIPEIKRKLPSALGLCIASMAEFLNKITFSKGEPVLTKFLVEEMSTDHYFDISKAKNLLKFTPDFSVEEGMSRTFKV